MFGKKKKPRRFVMADIHGCYDSMMKMLKKIDFTKNDTLYVIGDMIDRGPDSVKVVEYVRKHKNIIPIMGNHEWMLLQYETDGDFASSWDLNGNSEMKAFMAGMKITNPDGYKEYLEWFASMPKWIELDDYLLIHAGWDAAEAKLRSFESIEEMLKSEPEMNILWIRDLFFTINVDYIGKKVIFGHTPTYMIERTDGKKPERSLSEVIDAPDKIDIDCGAAHGGRLSCIDLDSCEIFYVEGAEKRCGDEESVAFLGNSDEIIEKILEEITPRKLTDEEKEKLLQPAYDILKDDAEYDVALKNGKLTMTDRKAKHETLEINEDFEIVPKMYDRELPFAELVRKSPKLTDEYRDVSAKIKELRQNWQVIGQKGDKTN